MGWKAWGALAVATAVVGCARGEAEPTAAAGEPTTGEEATAEGTSTEVSRVAVARLETDPSGPPVEGAVVFSEQPEGGLLIEADVAGLEPGPHGFHIHEGSECVPPTFESAGGHFAAEGQRHGGPTDPGHHLGDLGNLEVGPNGAVRYTIRKDDLTLGGGERSVAGRAVVIHGRRDDYQTQPSGDSGARVACGVIRPAG